MRALEDYSLRLKKAFGKHYRSVGFSEREFVRLFEPHLNGYNPHGNVFSVTRRLGDIMRITLALVSQRQVWKDCYRRGNERVDIVVNAGVAFVP